MSQTETRRTVIVRGRSIQAYCAGCGRNTEMITIELAAEALGRGVHALEQRISSAGGQPVKSGANVWVCWDCVSRLS